MGEPLKYKQKNRIRVELSSKLMTLFRVLNRNPFITKQLNKCSTSLLPSIAVISI